MSVKNEKGTSCSFGALAPPLSCFKVSRIFNELFNENDDLNRR